MVISVDLTKDKDKQENFSRLPNQSIFKRLKNKFKIWQLSYPKMPFSHKAVIFFLSFGVIGLASIGLIYSYIIFTTPKNSKIDTSYILLEAKSAKAKPSLELPTPPKIKNYENPINGELYTKDEFETLQKRKPLAIMIENSVDARPQAGLTQADLVYETLVESGITRFEAIFWSKDAPKVGPIRSVRVYFLDWASEYDDPPLLNIGQAGYDAGEVVVVPEADARSYIIKHNIKSFDWYGRKVTWRDYDKFKSGKAWEHVAYSETQTLWKDASEMGWIGPSNIEKLKFKKDEIKSKRPQSQEIEIKFLNLSSDMYKVKWIYDRNSNTYKRYLANVPHIDENNNLQISAKNIIIQHVQYKATGDKNGRILLTTIGEGTAEILLDGKLIKGKWHKEGRTARTHFYLEDGNEVELNRGQIWIEVVPVSGTKELSIVSIK